MGTRMLLMIVTLAVVSLALAWALKARPAARLPPAAAPPLAVREPLDHLCDAAGGPVRARRKRVTFSPTETRAVYYKDSHSVFPDDAV
jgi:hypothetical protein